MENLPELRILNLSGCSEINWDALYDLLGSSRCPPLEILHVELNSMPKKVRDRFLQLQSSQCLVDGFYGKVSMVKDKGVWKGGRD